MHFKYKILLIDLCFSCIPG